MAGLDPAIHALPNFNMNISMIKAKFPITTLAIMIATSSLALANSQNLQPPDFIGCNSDGQTGPIPAPIDDGTAPLIPKIFFSKLAYYKADQGDGILAPRGWYCFGYYGAMGNSLIVSPDPVAGGDHAGRFLRINGPAVELAAFDGETSGRYEVASIIPRLFPSQQQFVKDVISEYPYFSKGYPTGPYPDDIIKRRTKNDVAFETPANKVGMGTEDELQKTNEPIFGEAFLLGEYPKIEGIIQVNVRLPPKLRYLTPSIFGGERKVASQEQPPQ